MKRAKLINDGETRFSGRPIIRKSRRGCRGAAYFMLHGAKLSTLACSYQCLSFRDLKREEKYSLPSCQGGHSEKDRPLSRVSSLDILFLCEKCGQERKRAGVLPVHLRNACRKFAASLNPTSSEMSSTLSFVEPRYSLARLQRTSSRI